MLVEFDIIFSTLSNVFQIIGTVSFIFGLEREIMVGISCLLSWMTIFKFIRKRKRLVLMYEIIKLSMIKVLMFFGEFVIVFMGYSLLGLCLYPKVLFFSSLSKTVTTLVSLMLGDSIQMITSAIC
jgi:hypothetical protein